MVQATSQFLTLVTVLCLSTIILHPATGLPTSDNLVRPGMSPILPLVLPPLHRRLVTDTQEAEAEAGVVIPPIIAIREVKVEAEAEVVEENAKRGLPKSPGKGRPGSGTYYPGQPYGRRDDVEAVEENVKRGLPKSPGSGTYYPGQPYGRRDDVEAVEENVKRGLPKSPGSGTYYPGQPYGRRDNVDDASS